MYLFILKKLNSANDRSANAVKNIIASFGIKGVSILVQLTLVPLTIHYVDPTQYGIWLTLSSIVAWFSFFDIGFGNGLRNRFAEAKALGDDRLIKVYVSNTYICLCFSFFVLWTLFFIVNHFLDWSVILNSSNNIRNELSRVAIIVFSFFCLQIVLKTINTILLADQKTAKASLIEMLGQVFSLIVVFILTKTTQGSLSYLAFALGSCPILIMSLFTLYYFTNNYSLYRPSVNYFDKKCVADIFKLGYKFFFLQIAGVLIYNATNIIIINILNPESVTVYNISWKYYNIVTMSSTIIFVPFWSAFTDAYKKEDYNWMRNVYSKLKIVSIGLSFIVLLLLIISPYVFHFWIGDVVRIPFVVSLMIALYVIAKIFASFHFNILNGMGKLKIQLIVAGIGLIITIPLSVVLGKYLGLVGIIIPTILYDFLSSLFYYKQVKMILNNRSFGVWNQ